MKINSAEFIVGAASPRQYPAPSLSEVAFAGKSNVGKSSLINSLLNRKHLVKTSAAPGKTQQINFFLINGTFRFVDLPGYGFARAPRTVREQWEKLITHYLLQREVLRGIVVILDARHEPTALDRQMKAWLDSAGLPALYVANKVDKLSRSRVAAHLRGIGAALELAQPPLGCSARTGQGKDDLWRQIGHWLAGPPRATEEPR